MLDLLQNSGIEILNDQPHGKHATIIVVGVPRSGTTMVAKALQIMGVFLGAELDDAVKEDLRIARALETDQSRLAEVIATYNSTNDIWAFKRPMAYTSIDPNLFRAPRFVMTFRDPLAIAKREEVSMVSDFRNQLRIAAEWSANLVDFALRQTAPTMLISYEKALLKPASFVKELALFSGLNPEEKLVTAASVAVSPSPKDYVIKSQVRYPQDRTHHDQA